VGSNECRFTVLALFDDGTVGDITDWTQLTYQSASAGAVNILGPTPATETRGPGTAGVLAAGDSGQQSVITVSLKLSSPQTDLSATATVFTAPKWEQVGQKAKVQFVAGPLAPKEDDTDPAHPGSVAAVVEGKTNALFVAEGFPAAKEVLFRNIVKEIVQANLRRSGNLQPFGMLKNSMNYWSVVVESREEAVSVLDDHEILASARPFGAAFELPLPRPPSPSSDKWTLLEMMHEGGLPLPNEPSATNPQAWVASRSKIYVMPAQAPIDPEVMRGDVDEWNDLKSRTLLNERDTAFGLAHHDRPRASGQDRAEGRLQPDIRRTGAKSFETFLGSLKFGADKRTTVPYAIGDTWVESAVTGGKDFGLVCFICWSGTRGASWTVAVTQQLQRNIAFSTAATGAGDRVIVKAIANGTDLLPPTGTNIPAEVLASQIAYGFGRAFGLEEENGGGEKGVLPSSGTPNVQLEILVANTTAGARTIDARKILWLWPRIRNAGVVEVKLDSNGKVTSPFKCDQTGNASPGGKFLLVRLLRNPTEPFKAGNVVRLRAAMITGRWQWPSNDPIASFPLSVDNILSNGDLVLNPTTPPAQQLGYLPVPAGSVLDPSMLTQVTQCYLITPRILSGRENTLLAEPIFNWIATTNSPLNAPQNAHAALCAAADSTVGDVSPSNLPSPLQLPKGLPTPADIVGLYDGGAGFDCGVFRPAGRCRMRRGHDATTPFCHVCRYIIVDKVDPTKHKKLDDFYDRRYPA
jgi:hypothetical protein